MVFDIRSNDHEIVNITGGDIGIGDNLVFNFESNDHENGTHIQRDEATVISLFKKSKSGNLKGP